MSSAGPKDSELQASPMGSVLQLVQWTAQFQWIHDIQRCLGLSIEALKSGYAVINCSERRYDVLKVRSLILEIR